jgi:hypothetical protein
MVDFYGLPIRSLSNAHLRLEYLAEAGPRLVRLFLAGSETNLLAESPEVCWDTPQGMFFLRGGHRLWHAPEALGRSDVPDDQGLQVEELEDGVRLVGALEPSTGIVKSIEIHLHPQRQAITLLHRLTNHGNAAIELAPWAITQLPLGGTVVLPQGDDLPANPLQPDRLLVLWPYTDWADPRLKYKDGFMFLDAQPSPEPAKWGNLNRQGWIGYVWQGILFRKRFDPQVHLPHTDLGCNVEFYIKNEYVELETLGPLVRLRPGKSTWHQEIWIIDQEQELQDILRR